MKLCFFISDRIPFPFWFLIKINFFHSCGIYGLVCVCVCVCVCVYTPIIKPSNQTWKVYNCQATIWQYCHIFYKGHYKPWLPWCLSGGEPACQCRRRRRYRFDPWVRNLPWQRKWQPTRVFLPGESHGQRSLEGYSPWGPKESDMTKRLSTHTAIWWC